jgi:hypothetical protein
MEVNRMPWREVTRVGTDAGDSLREVLFCHQVVATIDLNHPQLNQ